MTEPEFKGAMLRGPGRCVMAVRENPEAYRQCVLWACTRDIAYDAQSEGTRAWYVHTMTHAYPDQETLIHASIEALKQYRPNGGWDLLHLSELLMLHGQEFARQAVENKYQELLEDLHNKTNRVCYELEDLEQLGLVLATDRTSFLRIAREFGGLYREKTDMLDGEFSWFFATKGTQYRKTLERAEKKDENIACFLQRERAGMNVWYREQRTSPPQKRTGIRLSRWLAQKGDKETIERYALAYRDQRQAELRAEALGAFFCCPYPDDPNPVIQDASSTCEQLQKAAWRALGNIRHTAVYQFAWNRARNGLRTSENFSILITNYKPECKNLLEELLRERIAAEDWDAVHGAGMDILRVWDTGSRIPRPKHLLPLLYEYTPCASCRAEVVRWMSRHKGLTEKLLEECLYDSEEKTRRFAAKRWNGAQVKTAWM